MDESEGFSEELTEDKEEVDTEKRLGISKRIMIMGVSEKIKLAFLGNREARNILIKDSNKLVTTAVLNSPKITEAEVAKVTQSRSVDKDLLKIIAYKKEWLQNYQIRLGLVNNPKTPIQIALKLLSRLNDRDLKAIARNKNISSAITATAKYAIQRKGRA
ncbi:MAG: hypothetical protein ACE5IH_06485 [Thermodesulfobacteriota bacterium]